MRTLDRDQTEKVLEYIETLENGNDQLLSSLKKCVEVLTQFKDIAPDPDNWEEMIDLFKATLAAGERGHVSMKEPQITDDVVGSA